MKYSVYIREVHTREVVIEADSENQAIRKVESGYEKRAEKSEFLYLQPSVSWEVENHADRH